MRSRLAFVTATSLIGLAAPAMAAEAGSGEMAAAAAATSADAADTDEHIIVTGERGEYGARSTSTATKTNTNIRNIPQALTVISEKQIEDQSIRSVAELLTFVPGATPGTGESNRDQFTLRGNNTTADFFIDGVRDDAQYFRDFYNVDRVEVLKGPNAMISVAAAVAAWSIESPSARPSAIIEKRDLINNSGGLRLSGDFNQAPGTNAAFESTACSRMAIASVIMSISSAMA
jgi:catecholate siderophore receptor